MSRDFAQMTRDFEAGTIDPNSFDHEAHLAVAFHLLRREDFLTATALYARQIREMAKAAGVPEKFNTTITVALMSLLAERMTNYQGDEVAPFLAQNPDLKSGNLLSSWYQDGQLQTPLAKQIFMMPRRAA